MCDDNCDLDDEEALRVCEERRYEWLQQSDLDEVLPKLTDRQLQMALGCASHLWLDQTIEWRVKRRDIQDGSGPKALAIHASRAASAYTVRTRDRDLRWIGGRDDRMQMRTPAMAIRQVQGMRIAWRAATSADPAYGGRHVEVPQPNEQKGITEMHYAIEIAKALARGGATPP